MSLSRQKNLNELGPARHRTPSGTLSKSSARWEMPENQSEFLDWLLSMPEERDPYEQTEGAWAASHGVAESTLKRWKKSDRFQLEWTKRAAQKNISVERLQVILDMLYRKAVVGDDANAATRWLGWVEKYMPPVRVERDLEVAHLSDEELETELREILETEGDD